MTMSMLRSLCTEIGVAYLADHAFTVVASIAVFQLLFVAAAAAAPAFLGNKATHKQRSAWQLHVVSMAHCLYALITVYRYGGALADAPVFGYDAALAGAVAVSLGYFYWDAYASVLYSGLGFAIHGIACALVFTFGYRPFLLHFAIEFLRFELSTPFLNLHWFMERSTRWKGGRLHMINTLCLLCAFAYARIYRGWFMSRDFIRAMHVEWARIPTVLAVTYIAVNIVLNLLNVYWFAKMCRMVVRHASRQADSKRMRVNGNHAESDKIIEAN